jgi:hypothetical protein
LTAALLAFASNAMADCNSDGSLAAGGSGKCYTLKGSDTLFDIITAAINGARAGSITASGYTQTFTPITGSTDLYYAGTGSGNAETAMSTATATGIGVQSIGPMSRNFRPAFIDPLSPNFVARDATHLTSTGHAAWAPTTTNVVGLDAAVFIVKGGLQNIDFLVFTDTAVPTAFGKGKINNASIASGFNNGGGFGNLDSSCLLCGQSGQPACSSTCVNYNNIMSVVLSGVDGSGTIAACADPRRVQAIQDLAGYLGVTTLNHLFRRDDNSGTTDTFKDRIMVVTNAGQATYPRYQFTGGRFCNGTSIGGINGAAPQQGICSNNRATTCFVNTDCGTPNVPSGSNSCTGNAGSNQCVYCQFNLNNQDFDPIRRPCSPSDNSHAPTSCTDMTSGKPCQFGDGNANCTQGFIVALSDADPLSPDITVSIGKRVGGSSGEIMGYAGREAANYGGSALRINGTEASDANVRSSGYLLARRLFVQNSLLNSSSSNDIPTDNQTAISITGGGNDQLTKEQALWNGILTNRFLMDPIVRQYGFIRCGTANDGDDPGQESNNLCSVTPAAPVTGALGAFTPSGSFGGVCDNSSGTGSKTPCFPGSASAPQCTISGETCKANNKGGALSINSVGRVWNGAAAVQAACSGTGLCASGLACSASLCPDASARPSNAPCTQNSDCTSGHCSNTLGHNQGGLDGLYCQ